MIKRSLALIFTIFILSSASFAITGAPYFANNGVTLPAVSTINQGAKIISDGAGNFIIAWSSGSSDSERNIYAQKINSEGIAQWSPSTGVPVCTAADAQKELQLVSDGSTGAILAWLDKRDGIRYNIYAQKLNSAGVDQWTANGKLVCQGDWDKNKVRISGDGAGGAVLAWEDYRGATAPDIAAQKINSAGEIQWPQPPADYSGIIIYEKATDQLKPSIAYYNPAGGGVGALVAFEDYLSGTPRAKVVKIGNDGLSVWGPGIAKDVSSWNYSNNPEILHDGSGGAFIAIQVSNPTTDYGIVVQKLNDSGDRQWTDNGAIVRYITNPYLVNPHLVSDGSGGVVVAWSDGAEYSAAVKNQFDICAARINSSGTLVFPSSATEKLTVCGAPNLQLLSLEQTYDYKPIVKTDDNSVIIAWNDFRRAPEVIYDDTLSLGPSSLSWQVDIYAQKINITDGTARWMTNGTPLSTAVYAQGAPVLCQDGNGAAASYYDSRLLTAYYAGAQKVTDLTPRILSLSPSYGGARTVVTLSGSFGADATQLNGDPAYGGEYNQILFDATIVVTPDATWSRDLVTLMTPTVPAGAHSLTVKAYGEDSNSVSFISTSGDGPVVSGVRFGDNSYVENDYVNALPLISAQVESPYDFYLGSISLTIDGGSSINVPLTEYSVTTKRFSHQLTAAETGGTGLTDGSHTIVIYSTDAYGNTGTPFSCNVRVDSSAPSSVVSAVSYPGGGTYFDPSGGASGTAAQAAGNVVTIAYTLPNSVPIEYILYSSAGLVSGRSIPAGTVGAMTGYNEITWDGRLPTGEFVGSGIYPYQLVSGGKVISRGYIVVKHSR